jgi:hypothetical protein
MSSAEVLLFPTHDQAWGPRTRLRLARTLALWLVAVALALGAQSLALSPAWRAAALGLALPGAGFLYWAGGDGMALWSHVALFVLSMAAVGGALLLWFATGNVIAPFALWLGAAVAAGAMGAIGHHHHANPAASDAVVLAAAVLLLGVSLTAANLARAPSRTRAALNDGLIAAAKAQPAAESVTKTELSLEDLQLMRLLLDRALQPVEAFEGFEWLDQFQTAAVRYQINVTSWALSMAQFVHLPAFQGYLTEAQARLAAKQQNHRVWAYWRTENLWGNLRAGADPIPRENIMFSGFLAAQLAMFEAASGERAFEAPASLVFRHPGGERFTYDLPGLSEVLSQGWAQAPLGLTACEPNWVYPLCNSIAAAGVAIHDGLSGGATWQARRDRFLDSLEREFIAPDGRFVPCRSSYFGIALPPIGGAVGQAFPCLFLNAALPEVARRHWNLLRPALATGALRRSMWRVDVGNYRFTRASSYAATAAAAVEMGDDAIARRLLQALDQDCPHALSEGVAHRPGVSLWAHAVEFMARAGRADALRDMARKPAPARGPRLAEACYPAVLPARAVAHDGALDLVLYPGLGAGPQQLLLTGLEPDTAYTVEGAVSGETRSDTTGAMTLTVFLDGRTAFHVRPSRGG